MGHGVSGQGEKIVSATRELLEVPVDGSQVIVGVFASDQEAQRARELLAADNFDMDNVKVVRKSVEEAEELVPNITPNQNQSLAEPEAQRMQGQVAAGGGGGATSRFNSGFWVGLIAGLLGGVALGLAVIEIPFVRAVLQNQLIAMIVVGLIGAVFGGFAGSFVGIDAQAEDLNYFTGELQNGAFLVAVRTNRIDEVFDILHDAGARNLTELEGH
jgi:hypothetical protein